jgi:hypothetical protein
MPTTYLLSTEAEIEAGLSRLGVRDCDYVTVEVADAALVGPVLARLTASQRLLAAMAAGPVLHSAIRASSGYRPQEWAFEDFLRGGFPPDQPVPAIPSQLFAPVQTIALGGPGDPVVPGLFPGSGTKLARLALAGDRGYQAETVLHAAEHAYDPGRPYHAHDAFACALAHPDIDATDLADRYRRHGNNDRGWRSRRKTHALLAWARRHSYLPDPSTCPCGHDRFATPQTIRHGLALARNWNTIQPLLAVIERDPLRWLGLFRCTRCSRFWAEDSMTSGHASLFFGYPITTDHPADWITRAEPLNLHP